MCEYYNTFLITRSNEDQTIEMAILNKDLLEVLPGVDEANAIAEELEKSVRFEIMLVAPQFLGKTSERTEVSGPLRTMYKFTCCIATRRVT